MGDSNLFGNALRQVQLWTGVSVRKLFMDTILLLPKLLPKTKQRQLLDARSGSVYIETGYPRHYLHNRVFWEVAM